MGHLLKANESCLRPVSQGNFKCVAVMFLALLIEYWQVLVLKITCEVWEWVHVLLYSLMMSKVVSVRAEKGI